MEPPEELLNTFGAFTTSWGFTTTALGEAQRGSHEGRQRLHLGVQQRQSFWDVSLLARTSFILDPEIEEYACSFRISAHLLNRRWPPQWKLTAHNHGLVAEQVHSAYREALEPFLDQTKTPAGMVRWLCEAYEPLKLMSPSVRMPLHRGLALTDLLPSTARRAARACLQEKLILIGQVFG